MHDWLSWNAARWELGERAVARGARPDEIEGGFEWDGWFTRDVYPSRPATGQRVFGLPVLQYHFPDVTGRWALSFSISPGTVVLDSADYVVWLPPSRRRFYLLAVADNRAGDPRSSDQSARPR
jgi:hypothetical protein